MALYPDLAQRAQAEIDSIVGRARIPNFTDRESLPYVDALLQEVMRISPPSSLGEHLLIAALAGLLFYSTSGIPHTTSEDMEFQGYQIPKNTTIHPNIW